MNEHEGMKNKYVNEQINDLKDVEYTFTRYDQGERRKPEGLLDDEVEVL